MSPRLKAWMYYGYPSSMSWEARHGDDRPARQVRVRIATTSKKLAADMLGTGLRDFNRYSSEVELNDDDLAHPGVVRIAPLDPGDTIGGTTGWRVAHPQPVRWTYHVPFAAAGGVGETP